MSPIASGRKGSRHLHLLLFVLLVGPFFLNDFASIYVKDWRLWLLIDYVAVKLLPLATICWAIRGKRMKAADFGLTRDGAAAFVAVFLLVTLAGTLIDQNGYRAIAKLPGYPPLGAMPAIRSAWWNWIDLTCGLLLVGVVEELVFRGFLLNCFGRLLHSRGAAVALAVVVFGLAHWSQGLHAVVVTTLIGAVFMAGYLWGRTLPAVMLAHFTVNFIDFAGVVPKEIFRFP